MAECIACKGNHTPGHPCPRCGTDNEPWERWRKEHDGFNGLTDFMAPGLFGPIVLTTLILPVGAVCVGLLWMFKQVVWPSALPGLIVLTFICLIIIAAIYDGRNRLRERELLNRVRRGPARFLSAGFRVMAVPLVVVIALSAWMVVVLSRPAPADPEQNRFEHLLSTIQSEGPFSPATRGVVIDILILGGPLSVAALGYASLTMAAVYSSSLSLALGYAHRMNQEVPMPIFLNPARLIKLVQKEAEQSSSTLGPGLVWEGMERTRGGGIKLTARCQQDRKIVEDLAGEKTDVPLNTKCEVEADPWGRIISITPKSDLQV